jgi:3-hydroxyacyl-[acyl-carrier-protein] dehydratase
MDIISKILEALPYGDHFRFVDSIESVDEETIKGSYTFRKNLPFFDSHFKGNPMVPGVLMIECMGQIGMVCHLIYLAGKYNSGFLPVLSNVEASFFGNADYDEPCIVTGKKIYFRHNILKSTVEMQKQDGSLIAVLTANIKIAETNE